MKSMASLEPRYFRWQMQGRVAIIRLDRPKRKNPLTFDSYAELRDTFRALAYAEDVDAVVFASNGGNFCSGGMCMKSFLPPRANGYERFISLYTYDRRFS